MKTALKRLLRRAGLEIKRTGPPARPGTEARGTGDFGSFLEDLRERGFAPSSILDVGANEGGWSRLAKAIFPKARCTLIEPQEEMRSALDEFCSEFPDSKYFLAGAGAEAGELEFMVYKDLVGSMVIKDGAKQPPQGGELRKVPILTIDEFVSSGKIEAPQLAKLDVQGFELEVIKGAVHTLPKIEMLVMEVSLFRFEPHWPMLHEVIATMASHGFLAYDFAGFLRRPLDGALGQTDVCFARENGCFRKSQAWV